MTDAITAWVSIIERIRDEHMNQGWSHYMFRLVRAIFLTNSTLSSEGGFILNWVANNYAEAALMLLRRELDQQASAENLRNLLYDIIEHATLLTRARYRARWSNVESFGQDLVDRTFDSFQPRRVAGTPEADHIDPDIVRADLEELIADVDRVHEYAERTRAHRTPKREVDTSDVTFENMHKAISNIRRIVGKYYTLLTLKSIVSWEPFPQFDTIGPFTRPWVTDHKAIAEITRESAAGSPPF